MNGAKRWRLYEPVTPGWLMDYLRLSQRAHKAGIIDDQTLIARLDIVFVEDDEPAYWSENPDIRAAGEPCGNRRQDAASAARAMPPMIEFQLPPQSPQSGWVFSISDTDPLPSIPHGHWKTHTNQRKLDPYLGYIYEGPRQTGERLPWRECNRFWRSKGFRNFAAAALEAAIADARMSAKRHISSRGVVDHLKLPR
jgi:hypothetical protein